MPNALTCLPHTIPRGLAAIAATPPALFLPHAKAAERTCRDSRQRRAQAKLASELGYFSALTCSRNLLGAERARKLILNRSARIFGSSLI